MHKAGFDVIVGSFEKQGNTYHAAITSPAKKYRQQHMVDEYKVLLSRDNKRTISFKIKKEKDCCWMPDKKSQVDPWVADAIGAIIESKILNSEA